MIETMQFPDCSHCHGSGVEPGSERKKRNSLRISRSHHEPMPCSVCNGAGESRPVRVIHTKQRDEQTLTDEDYEAMERAMNHAARAYRPDREPRP